MYTRTIITLLNKVKQICSVRFHYKSLQYHGKGHRENISWARENTGNLKIKFVWSPCIGYISALIEDFLFVLSFRLLLNPHLIRGFYSTGPIDAGMVLIGLRIP